MPTESLEYFDLGGRAQHIRHAYLIGGIEFEDKRIPFDKKDPVWLARKKEVPCGQIPVLTYNGKMYGNSLAILRFVGARGGTYPQAGTEEQLIVDDVLETVSELWSRFPIVPEDSRPEFLATKFAVAMEHISALVGDGKFVLGDSISIADLHLYTFYDTFGVLAFFKPLSSADFEKFPVIMKVIQNVKDHPKLKEYIAAGKN